MDPVSQAVYGFITAIGIAGIIGFAIGYALKKVFKLALILFGLFLSGLFYFYYVGVIEIHYDKLLAWAESIINTVLSYTSAVYNTTLVTVPTASGFTAGLVLGFKRG